MKKILSIIALGLILFSCETDPNYDSQQVHFNPLKRQLGYSGTNVIDMVSKPENGTLTIYSEDEILQVLVKNDYNENGLRDDYTIRIVDKYTYVIDVTDKYWFSHTQNYDFYFTVVTVSNN